ncbi:hypothetical protein LTR56_018150 [Elasticomyces elasticus]|nr:hypothetical protein LTR22_023128 [Elasticomyces elasticus]KAK3629263.1 hypothetical protein LTR56_018150 [Elasticomyces elasticus]KAK4912824.1 hypothetical protein LTR49_018786 [Elasticomyces elasticus]KAK5747322.1 hypothetical protein LTS12_022436 [Elasticomyces elasticus]
MHHTFAIFAAAAMPLAALAQDTELPSAWPVFEAAVATVTSTSTLVVEPSIPTSFITVPSISSANPEPTHSVGQPIVDCVQFSRFADNIFAIMGLDFEHDMLDGPQNAHLSGKHLKREIDGCGVVSQWKIGPYGKMVKEDKYGNDGSEWEWLAKGALPKTAKHGCLERALIAAGAPPGTKCPFRKKIKSHGSKST